MLLPNVESGKVRPSRRPTRIEFEAALDRRSLHDDGRRPLHVVERRLRVDQRELPRRLGLIRLRTALDLLDGVAEVGLRPLEGGAAHALLVFRKAVLKRRLRCPLEVRIDGGANHKRVGGQAADVRQRARLAIELIDEGKTRVAARPVVRGERDRRGLGILALRRGDRAIVLHAVEHVGETFLGAVAMAIGRIIVRALGQAGEEGALLDVQLLRRFAEVGARGHLDAPSAAAEVDRVQIELEDFVLAQRVLDARRDDDLAHLALVGDVVADQQVLHHLLRDRGAALPLAAVGDRRHERADHASARRRPCAS